jgi:predicted helicase
MQHMADGGNIALITCRQQSQQGSWRLVGVADTITEGTAISNKTKEALNFFFPLYLYPASDSKERLQHGEGRHPNFTSRFTASLARALNVPQVGEDALPKSLSPEDIFHYIYSVFHSPTYRSRYAEFLKIDFPRLPLTDSMQMFRALARLGSKLVSLHLLESPKLYKPITEFIGGRNPEIEKVTWSTNAVWIDKAQTIGFNGVPEAVWNFHIGGYQVCEKWLKDRKGRRLSRDDIAHYQNIVVALAETIRLMKEIDDVIDKHGGWPGAFAGPAPAAPEAP